MLLVASNIFMTFAWYRHLRHQAGSPLWSAVLVSWGIAFFEYCLAVPANRIGYGRFTLAELKVTQGIISLVVFGVLYRVLDARARDAEPPLGGVLPRGRGVLRVSALSGPARAGRRSRRRSSRSTRRGSSRGR